MHGCSSRRGTPGTGKPTAINLAPASWSWVRVPSAGSRPWISAALGEGTSPSTPVWAPVLDTLPVCLVLAQEQNRQQLFGAWDGNSSSPLACGWAGNPPLSCPLLQTPNSKAGWCTISSSGHTGSGLTLKAEATAVPAILLTNIYD